LLHIIIYLNTRNDKVQSKCAMRGQRRVRQYNGRQLKMRTDFLHWFKQQTLDGTYFLPILKPQQRNHNHWHFMNLLLRNILISHFCGCSQSVTGITE
jgi:hypothetical protein